MVVGSAPTYSGPAVTPDVADNLDDTFSSQYDNEPLAILAVIVVLGGMATTFIRGRVSRHGAAASLAILALGLIVAAEIRSINRLNNIQIQAADGTVTQLSPVYASPRIGFYLVLPVLLALAIVHAVLSQRRSPAVTHGPPLPEGDVAYEEEPPQWLWAIPDETSPEPIEPPRDHAPGPD
jgi:hypothetical protein